MQKQELSLLFIKLFQKNPGRYKNYKKCLNMQECNQIKGNNHFLY